MSTTPPTPPAAAGPGGTAVHTLLPVSTPREAARLARALLGRRRGAATATMAMFVLAGVAQLLAPLGLGRIVDVVRSPDGTRQDVVVLAVVILVATLVAGVATTLAIALLARAAEPALADLREDVVDRALHLDGPTLEAAGSGDLLSRVGDDVRLVSESITETVPVVLASLVAIVVTGAGLFGLDWRLGLAGLAVVPLYVAALRWYLPRSGPFYRREREANGERAEALLTGILGSRTLRSLQLGARQEQVVADASWRSAQLSIDVWRLLTRFFARNNRAELLGLLLILGTGFALVRGDETTVGAVTAAALLFHRLFNPIGAVVTSFDEVQSAGASLVRLAGVALLPTPEASPTAPAASGAPAAEPPRPSGTGLEVRGLTHAYGAAAPPAVRDLDLVLAPGERVAVVGASGAGKTTLGGLVAGRLRPDAGEVLVGGVALDDLQRHHRSHPSRLPVALVSQEVHVFSGTVRDNLLLADPTATDADLAAVLDRLGADRWVRALPDRLDTVVGEGAHPLTGAQAQHLALARLVLADPLVAVLDEATAEAGSAGARDLETAALAATEGRTSLVVAHRLTQARAADRVVVMHEGRVVEQGHHDDLVAAAGPYAALWAAWQG